MNNETENNLNDIVETTGVEQEQLTTVKNNVTKSHDQQYNSRKNESMDLNTACFVLGYN